MSDNFIKSMFYFFVTFLTIYPIFELFVKKRNGYVRTIIVILIAFFWFIAIKYKKIDDKEKAEAQRNENALRKQSTKLANELKIKTDSTNRYLEALKDSLKHVPVNENSRKIINNYIDKINTLNQY